MTHIMRIDEMSEWRGKNDFDFTALSDESDIVNRKKGATYLLSDNMGDRLMDKWKVAVFVKNVKEERELKTLCYDNGYMHFNGGEEIYDFGKCEVDGYPATISTDEFIEMFKEEEQGLHTLHNYCVKE